MESIWKLHPKVTANLSRALGISGFTISFYAFQFSLFEILINNMILTLKKKNKVSSVCP